MCVTQYSPSNRFLIRKDERLKKYCVRPSPDVIGVKANMNKQPLVSVIMPVYNGSRFVAKAVESILTQTYQHFEFIIIDDASTDNTFEILRTFHRKDKRIRLYGNPKHLGVSLTVKAAIKKVRGRYIARMDSDDIAYPMRLEKQVAYLESHPGTVAVGAQCRIINKNGKTLGFKRFPLTHEEIYRYIFTFIPVQQPTLTIARHRLPRHFHYYIDGMNTAEEVELLFKLFLYGKVENLPDVLLKYRLHTNNTSLIHSKDTFRQTLQARIMAITRYGYRPTAMGILTTVMETLLVLLLPETLLRELFFYLRGMKRPAIKLPDFSFPPAWSKLKQYALSLR